MLNSTLLRNTARAFGLQCSYRNIEGKHVWSPAKTLVKMIEDLSYEKINSDEDLKRVYQLKRQKHQSEKINDCHVAWGGKFVSVQIRSNQSLAEKIIGVVFLNESNSEKKEIELKKENERKTQDGFKSIFKCELNLPIGYHRLEVLVENLLTKSVIVAPPEKINIDQKKSWGPFIPLYALRTKDDFGIGSLKEAALVAKQLRPYGAEWMGMLPMLAGNFDHADCDPSPYSSLTRLFWNEIYLDVEKLINKYDHNEAFKIFQSSDFQLKMKTLREKSHVDYYGVYQLKKELLILLSDKFFAEKYNEQESYLNFKKENPEIDNYASFRSTQTREQCFHKFVQFEMCEALKTFQKENGMSLYMDYPVGVNDAGFDYKEFRSVFYGEVSVGAPPEPVFALGQDWGFPAFHPSLMQKDHYNYFRKSLRNHLRYCKILRLDHIMGLHRIYSVPKKFKGDEGVYLRFPPEQLFAVVILEAHLAGADLIGENLGTVPHAVEQIIKERNLNGMWVLECETWRSKSESFSQMPKNALACLNTHDMPMLSSFMKTTDLDLVHSLNILSTHYRDQFKKERTEQIEKWSKEFTYEDFALNAVKEIAAADAKYFVVNLEDLWKEEMPQNIPGTWKEYPNWRKKFAFKIEDWNHQSSLVKALTYLKEFRG